MDRLTDIIAVVMDIPAELTQLQGVRKFIAAQAAGSASTHQVEDLVQAVDEVVTNIIVHGYQGKPGKIAIELFKEAQTLRVVIRDLAPVFDPTQVPEPDLTRSLFERPLGGLGLHLARQCVDQMTHHPLAGGGNEIVLSVNVAGSG